MVQGRAGHPTAVQNSPGLLTAVPKVHHLASAEHVGLVEEGAYVCRGLLNLHQRCAPFPAYRWVPFGERYLATLLHQTIPRQSIRWRHE